MVVVCSKLNKERSVHIGTENFKFFDLSKSNTISAVAQELNRDEYGLLQFVFREGDVVIDIGGNVGMFSIYLAKQFPFLKIYSFEPVKENYENFKRNIKLNNITGGIVTLTNKAVTKDGRKVMMSINTKNSGASTVNEIAHMWYGKTNFRDIENSSDFVESITLENIFKEYDIRNCRMLKIDCEGCEYEVLYNTEDDILNKIETIRGEFHGVDGFSPKDLNEALKKKVKDILIYWWNPKTKKWIHERNVNKATDL